MIKAPNVDTVVDIGQIVDGHGDFFFFFFVRSGSRFEFQPKAFVPVIAPRKKKKKKKKKLFFAFCG